MNLEAVVVDDEAPARQRLTDLLSAVDDIRVVAVCPGGPEAVAAIREHRPDLLFLDVQMPEMDGFGVLAEVGPDAVPAVVFVTAYDRHALAAFDARAIDYLLKPFTEERFRETLDRARTAVTRHPARLADRLRSLLADLEAGEPRLAVRSASGVRLVDLADIGWVEADGNYVVVHLAGEALRTRTTLRSMAERLAPRGFVRIHQSYMVNRSHIRELQPWTHGEFAVVLRDGTSLVSSRTWSGALREMLPE